MGLHCDTDTRCPSPYMWDNQETWSLVRHLGSIMGRTYLPHSPGSRRTHSQPSMDHKMQWEVCLSIHYFISCFVLSGFFGTINLGLCHLFQWWQQLLRTWGHINLACFYDYFHVLHYLLLFHPGCSRNCHLYCYLYARTKSVRVALRWWTNCTSYQQLAEIRIQSSHDGHWSLVLHLYVRIRARPVGHAAQVQQGPYIPYRMYCRMDSKRPQQ